MSSQSRGVRCLVEVKSTANDKFRIGGKKLKVKDVRETVSKLTPEQMVEIVTKGEPPNMDGYAKDFSAAQIKQIVEHYRALAKK